MKPFKISMQKGDGLELYGQGETLTEALTNVVLAAKEYGTIADREDMAEAITDLIRKLPDADKLPDPAPRLSGLTGA